MGQLIIIVALLALMWFLLIRPQRQRQAMQARMLDNLQVGLEVVTAGGLYGEIIALDEEDVRLEVAPGTVVRVAKRAIAAVVAPEDEPEVDVLDEAAAGELDETIELQTLPDQPEVEDEQTRSPADSTGPPRR